MNQYRFAEFVIGGLHNRNNIYDIREFKLNGIRKDCYRSIFLFDDDFKYYVTKTGSVKGYSGKHLSDGLMIDFDGEDLDEVRKEVVKFIEYLHYQFELPKDYLRIAFSGNKGFHIAIPFSVFSDKPEPKENFWQIYKSIAEELTQGFRFVDYSIYELRRIFRLNNTQHSKSGLYKVPLTFDELKNCSISEITQSAEDERTDVEYMPVLEIEIIDSLNQIYLKWNNHKFNNVNTVLPSSSKRSELLDLMKGGADEGNRHHALIRLTGLFAQRDFDYNFILEWLRIWNQKNEPPLSDDRLEKESLRAFQDAVKKIKVEDSEDAKIYNLQEASRIYEDYAKTNNQKKVQLGFPSIDSKIRGIMPGETCCILGKTSVGKSAFLQNAGIQYAKESREPVLFFSMEMPITSVFERTLQIETGKSGYEIENQYRENSSDISIKANLLFGELPNFYCITKTGLNLESIKRLIKFAESNIYKQKTGLVLIDYLGLVKETGNDIYQQVSKIARGMKDLAKDTETPIVYLSQVTKRYSEFDELELGAARDSGAIDEASDFVLALWKTKDNRPDMEKTDIPLKLGILKNRKGGLGKISISMDKKSLKISEQ